jgi:hypothetical protein
MTVRSEPEEASAGRRDSVIMRAAPIGAYAALTVITILIALMGGSRQIVIAPLASSFVFAFGLAAREPDVMFLAWLDQGTNLTLLEAESSAGSILVVSASVIAILVLADVAHATASFRPYGWPQGMRQLGYLAPRLLLVGAASCLFALVGLYFAPVLTASSDQVPLVAVLAVAALASIVVVGTSDR